MIDGTWAPAENKLPRAINTLQVPPRGFRRETGRHYRHFWQQNQGNPIFSFDTLPARGGFFGENPVPIGRRNTAPTFLI
jgi:hypothetical protein